MAPPPRSPRAPQPSPRPRTPPPPPPPPLPAGPWRRAAGLGADDPSAHPLLRGQGTRVLYDHGVLAPEAAALHLSRALSPSVPPPDAGDWLDGFLGQSGQILLHDLILRRII